MEIIFYTWPIKKIKNKKNSNHLRLSEFAELDGEGVILDFFFYEDANQNEIFRGVKTKNDIYYGSEKHY